MADDKTTETATAKTIPEEEGAGSLDVFLTPPSPAKSEGEKEEVKEEVKTDAKDDAKVEDQKTDVTVKAEDKPSTDDVKTDAKDGVKDPDQKLDPDAEKKAEEEKKLAEKPKVDWEDPSNPYKKRFRDTSNWATNLNKKQQEQDREILILKKKEAGTYDEARDNPARSEEQIEEEAASKGRSEASYEMAIDKWGAEKVEADLVKFNETFGNDQFMLGSVASSKQPVIEAIKALRRYEFAEEFGDDPVEVQKKIGEKAVTAAGEKTKSDEAEKLKTRVKVKAGEAVGLAGLTSKTQDRTSTEENKVAPLQEVFDS